MELFIVPQEDNENSREYAYRLLRSNIMTMKLPPGTTLSEDILSDKLNMSRTPIHEAITKLKEEWLVEVLPQRGTKVTLINPSLMKEGYSVRVLLEAAVLNDSAGNLTNPQLLQLLSILKKQEESLNQSAEQIDSFIRLDDEFHKLLYFFGGRSHTWTATRGLVSHYDRARYLDALSGNADFNVVLRQHRELCDYMLMGFPSDVSAKQKLSEHLTSFRENSIYTIEKYRHFFSI
jgi:DNA-binding GntR family transcriptional regulator